MPGKLSKSILFSTGTEANEFAFRLAKTYTGRTGIAGLSRGYYGTSLATKSISSLFQHGLKDTLPLVPESIRIPITSQCEKCFTDQASAHCGFPCLDALDDWIGDWGNLAAVIIEPIMSAGGMLVPPTGYLATLHRLARERGVLLIADEAQTGFGRTGKWFAVEHHGIEPDIITISKSCGNGFPVAGVVTTPEIADEVISRGLWNLSSHQSDPVGAAAVCAVIDIVRDEDLVTRAGIAGDYFMRQLRDLAARWPLIGKIRGQGLMIGFDLVIEDPEEAENYANAFMYMCRQNGLHLTFAYGSRIFRVIPPLVITNAEIDRAIEIMELALKRLSHPGSKKIEGPTNPFTSRMMEQRPVSETLRKIWRSSPQEWLLKAKELIRK